MDGLDAHPTGNANAGDAADLRVLLIDGHALVLRFMTFALTTGGCRVTTAATAEDAMRLLAGDRADLVIADVEMPGLAAPQLLQAVARQQPGVPVVLTSTAAAEPAVATLRDQTYDYLKQPFSAEDVLQLVRRMAEDRRRQPATSPHAAAGPTATVSSVEALCRIGTLGCHGSDMGAFVEAALDEALGALGGDAIFAMLRDEGGHVTVSQKGDRALVAALVDLLNPSLDTLYAGDDGLCLPLDGPGITALATPIPGSGRTTAILCLGRRSPADGLFAEARTWLPAYALTIGLSLQKLLLSESLEGSVIDTISSFVVALETKDGYLKGHSARVSLYAGEIAKTMGLPPAQVALARRAGVLHDLGKLVVKESIHRQPGDPADEASQLVREHPAAGASILKPLRSLVGEAEAIKRHHERYDGGGYPDGLAGDEIPLTGRLIAVADAFDVLTSTTPPGGKSLAVDAAVQEVLRQAGTRFDPAVTEAFARIPLARLTEIAGFYDNPPDGPAVRMADRGLRVAAACEKLRRRPGWSAGHATEEPRRIRTAFSGITGAALRRPAPDG